MATSFSRTARTKLVGSDAILRVIDGRGRYIEMRGVRLTCNCGSSKPMIISRSVVGNDMVGVGPMYGVGILHIQSPLRPISIKARNRPTTDTDSTHKRKRNMGECRKPNEETYFAFSR